MKNIFFLILSIVVLLLIPFSLAYLSSLNFISSIWESILIRSFILIIIIQIIVFIPSFIFKTEHYFDLTGGITFIIVILYAFYEKFQIIEFIDFRSVILVLFILIWSLRLSLYLFFRVKVGGDVRFIKIKKNFLRFMCAWIFQGTWVFICSFPVLIVLLNKPLENDLFLYVGIFFWVFGFLFEVIADRQKVIFNKTNKGKFISTGLWSFSRHPNYFGELVLWLGITIISLPTFSEFQYLGLITPIFIYLLLTKVSGVNLLEELAEKRWGNSKDYILYKNNTPVFFPRLFK
jgi:steroid 5-alpha reductase family enzyme